MNFEYLHPRDRLVMMIDRIYRYGMTTTSGGNLSVKDASGVVYITPGGIDKGTLKREDIVKVSPDGTITGIHKPSVELPFHLEIYRRRPDIKAIVHAHPPSLVAFSVIRRVPEIMLTPDVKLLCGEVVMAPYALPGSQQLGDNIADCFEKGHNTVMLENHGVVIGAPDLFQAFMGFETLDFAARTEINAASLSDIKKLPEEAVEIYRQHQTPNLPEFERKVISSEDLSARRELCILIKRAYDQRLFTSTNGTFSQRLSDGSFVITPTNKDRKYLEPEDLVLMQKGARETGKTPSRAVLLHKEIYDKNPEINSVIIAHPPHIMAFGVTNARFDSRLIPESYILLKNVERLSFGTAFLSPEKVAKAVSSANPVVIENNNCVVVTAGSLLNAFDRLEVLEYSAKSLLDSMKIGELVKISDSEIADLDKYF